MRLKETYESNPIHDQWESVYRTNPIQNRFNDQIMDRLIGLFEPSPGALFLDAGCGTGDHSIRIAARGFHCVGIDISETILAKARQNAANLGLGKEVLFSSQSLEDLAIADCRFDIVHCRGVLMHIPEWEKALEHLCRILKPGGTLIITLDNKTNLTEPLFRLWIRLGLSPFYIGKTYSVKELEKSLGEVGLSVIESTAIIHNPRFFTKVFIACLRKIGPNRFDGWIRKLLSLLDSLEKRRIKYLTAQFIATRATK